MVGLAGQPRTVFGCRSRFFPSPHFQYAKLTAFGAPHDGGHVLEVTPLRQHCNQVAQTPPIAEMAIGVQLVLASAEPLDADGFHARHRTAPCRASPTRSALDPPSEYTDMP